MATLFLFFFTNFVYIRHQAVFFFFISGEELNIYTSRYTHLSSTPTPPPSVAPSSSSPRSAANWAVSGVQVEPIWIPCGRDHCGGLGHSPPSHLQTIYNPFLPACYNRDATSTLHCDLRCADMHRQMDGRINIVIRCVFGALSIGLIILVENVRHLCQDRDALQSCFKISLYSVHLARHQILKCMRHRDQCYWHWNLL